MTRTGGPRGYGRFMDSVLKRLLSAPPVAVDGVVTALITIVTGAAFRELAFLPGTPHWAAATIAALAVVPAAWRRRWPRAVLAVTAGSWAAAAALSTSPVPALAVAFVIYLIPPRFSRRDALWMLVGTLLALAAGLAVFAVSWHGIYRPGGGGAAIGLLAENGLLVTVAWLIGYSVRQHRAYLAGQREQAEQQALAQMAEAHRARTEERLRIAREVHDVVGHTMSVIAVQAGVASYVGRTDPDEAIRALSSIDETSRGALREMRALLAVLRAESDRAAPAPRDAGLVPAPGLADLGALVARTAEAGVTVDLGIRGERRGLPAGLDLAAYRVIQEAVTNVIKHAATDRCTVTVDYQDDSLTLDVADVGVGSGVGAVPGGVTSPGRVDGAADGRSGDSRLNVGHGIAGMRERVGMYDGEFQAGPRPGQGFQVTARFPLKDAAT
jgi:signal transduction histidine kinase